MTRLRPRVGDRIMLRPAWIDLEGRGVAELAGEEVHVADLLPGEEAEVELRHVSRQMRRAFGERIGPPGERSADRTGRACPVEVPCGGCAWQHLAYPAQLAEKRRRVERALASVLPQPPPVEPVAPSPVAVGYRNKATYVIAPGSPDAVRLGAFAPRSHRWIDTSRCVVVAPAIQAVLPAAGAALAGTALAVYHEGTQSGVLRYLVARASRAGDVLLGVVTTSDAPRERLAAAARTLVAGSVRGVVWVPNDATSGAIMGSTAELLAGSMSIEEHIAGVPVEISIDTFVQIHLDQAEAIYRRLAEIAGAGPGMRAIDLYCGVGAIALALAARGAHVVGVERNPAAVAAARAAAVRAGLAELTRFEAAPAEEADLLSTRAPADLLVVNPPRQGLAPALCQLLAAAGPPVLAYVSCGPESLARDLAVLAAAAYRIERIEPFDLMPGTGHVECLVMLMRH
jgi:23S rRNA (uracil1939-C5)-methyltransferase